MQPRVEKAQGKGGHIRPAQMKALVRGQTPARPTLSFMHNRLFLMTGHHAGFGGDNSFARATEDGVQACAIGEIKGVTVRTGIDNAESGERDRDRELSSRMSGIIANTRKA